MYTSDQLYLPRLHRQWSKNITPKQEWRIRKGKTNIQDLPTNMSLEGQLKTSENKITRNSLKSCKHLWFGVCIFPEWWKLSISLEWWSALYVFTYVQLLVASDQDGMLHSYEFKQERKDPGFSFILAIRDSFITKNESKFRFSLTTLLTGSSEQRESKLSKIKIF